MELTENTDLTENTELTVRTVAPAGLELAGATAWLPPERQTPADAVLAGDVPADRAEEFGYRAIVVTPTLTGPELAVAAASSALSDAGMRGRDIDVVLHAHSHYQGHDFFSPAHRVAHEAGATDALAIGVEQMCNGAAAAVQLAVGQLAVGAASALLTTGDSFRAPGFDRWGSDYGMVYGDAGTAVVLRERTGRWPELLAVSSISLPVLEGMHRHGHRGSPAARWVAPEVDVRSTKRAFLRAWTGDPIGVIEARAVTRTVSAATEAAGLAASDLQAIVLPRLGQQVLDGEYRKALLELTDAQVLDPGQDTGHLGAGDLIAGLATLAAEDTLAPGRTALLLSVGAGFTWSAVVVRRAAE